MEVCLFEGVEADPSVETVMRGAEKMREFQPDWIVSVGGGSPNDEIGRESSRETV